MSDDTATTVPAGPKRETMQKKHQRSFRVRSSHAENAALAADSASEPHSPHVIEIAGRCEEKKEKIFADFGCGLHFCAKGPADAPEEGVTMRTRLGFGMSLLAAGLTLAAGCESGDFDEMEDTASAEQASTWANASDITIAQTFRPRFRLRNDHNCWPLSFHEIATTANSSARNGMKSYCKKTRGGTFGVFASVQRAPQTAGTSVDNESFRVTYGVAFGNQESHLGELIDAIADLVDEETGTHGEDAQYVVADIVNGKFTSAWADLHKGSLARSKSQLTMFNDNRVTVWPGKYYNSLRLVESTTTACDFMDDGLSALAYVYCMDHCSFDIADWKWYGSCGGMVDYYMNFGDPVGADYQMDGSLIMVEDVCNTTGNSYTSPDNVTYTDTQLDALRAYIGCTGAPNPWERTFKSKSQYADPYDLPGCQKGNTSGGNICYASNFGPNDTWTTTSSNASFEPGTVGRSYPEKSTGDHFNDLLSINSVSPKEISIAYGERVDGIRLKYNINGVETVKSHGELQTSHTHTITGLDTDPIVSVKLCEGTAPNGSRRVGRIELTTAAGRKLSGGDGSYSCVTSAPAGQRLFGFYGREGASLDFLGTYWGSDISSSQSITDWFGDSNQGAGMAVANIDSDERADAVVVHIDNPNGGNNGYYRVLWNMDWVQPTSGSSTYLPTTISDPIAINGWWGDNTSGAGAAIGDIDKNGRPDLVVLHIDNPAASDYTYYRIGWNLNTNGVVTSWSAPINISAGFHGYDTAGADIALRDIDNNGNLDMVIGTVDPPSGADTVYYNVGMNLSTTGIVSSWSSAGNLPSTISSTTADLGMDLADMDGNGKPDLLVSWVDSAAGNDSHYYRVGYDLTSTGSTTGWSAIRTLNSALSSSTQGADIAAYDFSGNNNMELANFHIVDSSGGNTGTWDVKTNRSDIVYSLKGKHSQKCLTIQNGSTTDGDKLVQYTCSGLASQKFTFSATDAGGYHLIVKSSGKCLDNPNFSPNNGTVQQQWSCNYSNAQRFQLTSPSMDYINGPLYFHVQNAASSLCLDVAGNSISNNGNIVQWSCSDVDHQDFELVQVTN